MLNLRFSSIIWMLSLFCLIGWARSDCTDLSYEECVTHYCPDTYDMCSWISDNGHSHCACCTEQVCDEGFFWDTEKCNCEMQPCEGNTTLIRQIYHTVFFLSHDLQFESKQNNKSLHERVPMRSLLLPE